MNFIIAVYLHTFIYSRRVSNIIIAAIRISEEKTIILFAFLRLCCVLSIGLNLEFIIPNFDASYALNHFLDVFIFPE